MQLPWSAGADELDDAFQQHQHSPHRAPPPRWLESSQSEGGRNDPLHTLLFSDAHPDLHNIGGNGAAGPGLGGGLELGHRGGSAAPHPPLFAPYPPQSSHLQYDDSRSRGPFSDHGYGAHAQPSSLQHGENARNMPAGPSDAPPPRPQGRRTTQRANAGKRRPTYFDEEMEMDLDALDSKLDEGDDLGDGGARAAAQKRQRRSAGDADRGGRWGPPGGARGAAPRRAISGDIARSASGGAVRRAVPPEVLDRYADMSREDMLLLYERQQNELIDLSSKLEDVTKQNIQLSVGNLNMLHVLQMNNLPIMPGALSGTPLLSVMARKVRAKASNTDAGSVAMVGLPLLSRLQRGGGGGPTATSGSLDDRQRYGGGSTHLDRRHVLPEAPRLRRTRGDHGGGGGGSDNDASDVIACQAEAAEILMSLQAIAAREHAEPL